MFHHLAVTYQQQANQVIANLYIDGQCARAGMVFNGYLSNSLSANVPLTIGAVDDLRQWPFTGVIDEVKIYNRVLSASEILGIYSAQASGVCWDIDGNGLPDWWEMQYFGHLGNDPNADPDGDGYTNLEEYNNHSNPLVPDPHAAIYEPKLGLNVP